MTIVVDEKVLERGTALPHERCEIPGVGVIPADRVRELREQAKVWRIHRDARGGFTDSNGRYLSAEIVRLLDLDQQRCGTQGCNNTHWLEVDHNVELRDGGSTTYDNLERHCAGHHRLKTNNRMLFVGQRGNRRMRKLRPNEMGVVRPRDGP